MTIIVIIKMHKKKNCNYYKYNYNNIYFNAIKFKVLNTDILGNTVH